MSLAAAGAFLIAPLSGCSSSTVKVDGGVGLLGQRRVKVGEEFTISQPFDARTGTEWRLTQYDSAFIAPSGTPRLEGSEAAGYTRVTPFIAKAPGETSMVFLRRNREPIKYGEPLPEPKSQTIRVKIVP